MSWDNSDKRLDGLDFMSLKIVDEFENRIVAPQDSDTSEKIPQKSYDVDVDGHIYKCSSREEAAYFLKQKTRQDFFNDMKMNSSYYDWSKFG